jgi:aminoglycoside phosphotransferase (APT) family kinase protein
VDEAHTLLAERVPAQPGTAIVHGDYRLDNTVISADGQVRAVLDWELCTLGDPLADVGILVAYWDPELAAFAGQGQRPTTALPGFPEPADLVRRYAARSGRDLSGIGFYVAFALWKLACIAEGVYVRYAARAMGSLDVDEAIYRSASEDRAQRALEILRS